MEPMNQEPVFERHIRNLIQNLEEYTQRITGDIVRYQERQEYDGLPLEEDLIDKECSAILQQQVNKLK